MVTASHISRLSQAVDQIEKRLKQNRPLKIVKVRCGYHEDRDAAQDRHFAAHPEDRDADIVVLILCDVRKWPTRVRVRPPAGAGMRGTLKTASQDVLTESRRGLSPSTDGRRDARARG